MPDSPQNSSRPQTDKDAQTTQGQTIQDTKQDTKQDAKTRRDHWWSQYLSNRRRIGTVAAILVALFLAWHVVNGRNGLTSWQQKRAENKSLATEIDRLTGENAHLSQHVDRLRSDPGAIEHEARARLRYARPNEVIWSEPQAPQPQVNPAPGK